MFSTPLSIYIKNREAIEISNCDKRQGILIINNNPLYDMKIQIKSVAVYPFSHNRVVAFATNTFGRLPTIILLMTKKSK